MDFRDIEIEDLDITKSIIDFYRLIVEYFCGRKLNLSLSKKEKELLNILMYNLKNTKIGFEQFNEILLLMNQDTIGEDFFRFCFENERIGLDDLKNGVMKFRGFAILCFANFRFAFRELAQEKQDELRTVLSRFYENPSKLESSFTGRPAKMLDIESISRDETYFVGEFSGGQLNKEEEFIERKLRSARRRGDRKEFSRLLEIEKKLTSIKKQIERVQERAFKNTDIYLTWDYIDVYVATSMRNKWEFEETYDFVHEVFEDPELRKLNLRVFDPTQSKCSNPRDKGLIEGLMLKRAKCAIYMAQEGDTMGKDCELAATLAQSKPVIVYVPEYDPEEYSEKMAQFPLDFFKRRLQILDAEGVLNHPKCQKALRNSNKNFESLIDEFLRELDKFKSKQPYTLVEIENKFKKEFQNFSKLCEIISIAECYNFDQRARLLKGLHPLCMQVDLLSGVANGVLVVRNPQDCAKLLYALLTNRTKFEINHEKEGFTVLKEEISGCAFRIITDYEKLTNSFWNLFGKT